MCSDEAAAYDEQLEAIRKTLVEAERISTEEVEKVQAGANADIIFNGGERVYNKDGSVVKAGEESKDKKVAWTSLFDEVQKRLLRNKRFGAQNANGLFHIRFEKKYF